MAYKEVTVDVDIELDDFDTQELIDELESRAKGGDKDALLAMRGTVADVRDEWQTVERLLERRDFDRLADWLWPQVRAQWPKPTLKAAA